MLVMYFAWETLRSVHSLMNEFKTAKDFWIGFQRMDRDIVGKLSGDGLDRFTASVNTQLAADRSSAAGSSVVSP